MGTDPAHSDDLTEDAFLAGRLTLRQFRRGHRAGHDAILLAAAVPAHAGERIVEFGSGVGAAGLALARRVEGMDLTLVEIDSTLVDLAQTNAAANDIVARAIVLDIGASAAAFADAGLPPDHADHVMMNPPFHAADRHRASPDEGRRTAHLDMGETLDVWSKAARRILKPGGCLTLIWRADELDRVLGALERGFGAVEVIAVHPKPDAAAIRVLVRAIKGSHAPLRILPGLVLNDRQGRPTPAAEHVLHGNALGSTPCGKTASGLPEK
ncbi:methyltransferase [[Pseudomonas] carboxydohydrogena]|uniref:Methyltransferase n=1 Tax=Afipia carboxydohydrogena TaxID=290 RepID=A0ABY8BPF0_AFICR|nr:methyltransferase [[Pseudomonas] carboxydohydrogena]WEF50804.1 methyltransferase [[Pseudomonas] carboxydohydrogena]